MSLDILENIFKVYKISLDQDFIKYTKTKDDNHEEGKELFPYKLTHLEYTKFHILKGKGVWNYPSN